MEIINLLLVGALGWFLAWSGLKKRDTDVPMPGHNRREDWKRAVERCGLQTAGKVYPQLTARSGSVEVKIETWGTTRDTRIVIKAPVALDFERVKIHSQSAPRAREVNVGDPRFDNAFSLEGPALQLSALLDDDTRRRLCAVSAAWPLEVSRDGIVAVVSPDAWMTDILPSLLAIARRLGTPAVLPRDLVENVKQDSESGVRLQNLLLLVREFPGDPATVEALRAACSDRSSAIRLRAARELGAEGRDTLLQVAYSMDDDAISAKAVSILDRDLPVERAKAILDLARNTGSRQTALACVKALGRGRGGDAAAGLLAEVLASPNVTLAVAAVRALAPTRSPAAETALIRALRHEEADIRVAAAEALRDFGTAMAVLPLQQAIERSRLDLDLRRAARQAIDEIQSRVQGAAPGQLSLAGTEAGQLSLAQEGGELSLADDPAGRLTIPPERDPA
jgi:hypothetical protein